MPAELWVEPARELRGAEARRTEATCATGKFALNERVVEGCVVRDEDRTIEESGHIVDDVVEVRRMHRLLGSDTGEPRDPGRTASPRIHRAPIRLGARAVFDAQDPDLDHGAQRARARGLKIDERKCLPLQTFHTS